MLTRFLPVFSIVLVISACSPGEPAKTSTVEPSAPADPHFERVAPETSGITFANIIKEDHQLNIITNSYMYNGGGVAVLDANRDGRPDLYFVGSQESNRLYLNQGELNFQDITEAAGVGATGGFKTGVTVVDINGDGYDDLYVCRTGLQANDQRRNLLYLNNGDLTFTESAAAYGLDDISASNHANFFDYDLDGDLDVYVLNHPVDFSSVNNIALEEVDGKRVKREGPRGPHESDRLYRNEGNGAFTDVSEQAGIVNRAFGLSVTVSDFNHDGYPDLYVGNDYIEPDYLYINNRNGTFTDRIDEYFRHTSNHTMGVDIADFNNDGMVDVAALDMIAEDNRRQKLLMTTMDLQRYNTLVRYGYGHQIMRNVLQLNTGEGGFADVGTFAGISNTDWSWSVLFQDFDNDGWKDLYITNGYRRDVTNMDYLTYTVDSLNRTGGINKQRFPEFDQFLNMIPSERLQNYLFRNKGDLSFEKVTDSWGLPERSFSNGSAYADLDGDGDEEIITNNIADPAFVYRNLSREKYPERHYLQITLQESGKNTKAVGAKVQLYCGDRQQYQEVTPTRGFFSSSSTILHFGLGDCASVDRIEITWPDGAVQVLDQVAADQRLTVEKGNTTAQTAKKAAKNEFFRPATGLGLDFIHQENEFEDFDRERLLPHRLSRLGPFAAVADVNGDGREDLFVGGAAGQAGMLYLQQANSTFRRSTTEAFALDQPAEDLGCLFFDADGDGDPDLYVVSGGSAAPMNSELYQDRLYLNDGQGQFSRTVNALPKMTSSGSCVQAQDYDGDGDLDLFVGGRVSPGAYPSAPQSFILRNEGGKFSDVTVEVCPDFQTAGMITDIRWGDLDGDGQAEMITAGEWLPISVYKVVNGKLENQTAAFGLAQTEGWWNCLALADVDSDGDQDLIAGNLGLNTRLHASAAEPLKLLAKDFDHNGSIDPIITYYNGGKEYPLARREMLIKQLPGLKKKFVYFEPYSTATVEQVFSSSDLQDATTYRVHTFQSTYFENQGNGSFQVKPLPNEAQLAPTNQIVADDLNGDGRTDLLLVGNNYSSDVESGRYDASNGLCLLNDGKGGFEPVWSSRSGFLANLDARDLCRLHLANGSDLYLVTNNNGRLLGFLHQGGKALQ